MRRMSNSGPTWLRAGFATLALLAMAKAFGQAAPASPTAPGYTLQPGDKIEISVWGEEQLQREVMIRPDGKFSFPLTGEVNAIGRTVADVQQEMTTKLVMYIPEAVVTVSVTGLAGNRVYVIGQVSKPGTYDMNPRINVLQALSLAGGTTPFAALNDIIIIRGNGKDQRVLRFAYDDIKRGRNLEQNIELDNGDVVIVP
jgi:polysaccharide biosynthesis/export protein